MDWGDLPIPLWIVVSILLNTFISVAGVIPSAFLTALNVQLLGFGTGVTVSIIGEAIGAVVSFMLYRAALHRYMSPDGRRLNRLREADGAEAWFLVLALRLLPFIPSGLVTLSAAFSHMSLMSFVTASTIGKVPALILEALAVTAVLHVATGWKFTLLAFIGLVYLVWHFSQRSGENI